MLIMGKYSYFYLNDNSRKQSKNYTNIKKVCTILSHTLLLYNPPFPNYL